MEPSQPSQPVGMLLLPSQGSEIEVGPDDIEVMIHSIMDNVLSQFDANVEPLLDLLVEEEAEDQGDKVNDGGTVANLIPPLIDVSGVAGNGQSL